MPKIKAVELMRKIRDDLESRDACLSLMERTRKMRQEVESNPLWKDFLKRHQNAAP